MVSPSQGEAIFVYNCWIWMGKCYMDNKIYKNTKTFHQK